MLSFWFIAGPPFDSPMWVDVLRRMRTRGIDAQSWDTLTEGTGTIKDETDRLVSAINQATEDVVLIGHGTALPLVMAAAETTNIAGLVLSNGPLGQPDALSRGLSRIARLPRPLARALFSPNISLPLLASSLGLRRTVVNPYVMDRDTTVAICGPILKSSDRLGRALRYFETLSSAPIIDPSHHTKTLLCWGDSDPITSRNYERFIENMPDSTSSIPVEGGRYLHPVERPWALADTVLDWAATHLTTT